MDNPFAGLGPEAAKRVKENHRGCRSKSWFTDKRDARRKARRYGIHFYKCTRCFKYHLTKISAERWEALQQQRNQTVPERASKGEGT